MISFTGPMHRRTMKCLCSVRHIVIIVAAILVIQARTQAQVIEILPRGAGDTEWTTPPFELGDPLFLEDGAIRLYAVLELEGATVDITEMASWAVTSDGFTSWNSGQKALGVAPGTTAVVRVSFAGIEATTTFRWLVGEEVPIDRPLDDRDVPHPQDLADRVTYVLDELEAIGMPVDAWRDAAQNTEFRDDRNGIQHTAFGFRIAMTGPDAAGRFFRKGWQLYLSENGYPCLTNFPTDFVVLRPDVAEGLVNPAPDNPLFRENPNLVYVAEWAKVPLHELIHKILFYEDLEKDFPTSPESDPTEDLVRGIELVLLQEAVAILRTLAQPEITNSDRQALHWAVYRTRQEVKRLRERYGTDLVNTILEALGWSDADGDGLPDWLEQKLRDKGIDPDQPIWTPAPGGGGNPLPVDEDPLPPDGDIPTIEPTDPPFEPADPNG